MEKVRFYFHYSVYGKWDITDRRDTEDAAWDDIRKKVAEYPNASYIQMRFVRERYTVKDEGSAK